MRFIITFLVGAGLSAIAVAGCGGSSFQEKPSGTSGDSGSSSVGGSSAGGSSVGGSSVGGSSVGGSSAGVGAGGSGAGGAGGSTGGQAQGGSSGQGGAAGGGNQAGSSGAAGAGGEPSDSCRLPAESGPCEAAFERWYFNAERGVCQVFTYGGCDGNENNFESLEACHEACAGHGMVDVTACDGPTECVVTAAQCCGGSSTPTVADVTAVNTSSLEEFTAPCQLVDCVSTLYPIPAYFGATCSGGHCVAFDVRETELTACNAPSDCFLRNGLSCCEGCTGEAHEFVALNVGADLAKLVCGDSLVPCPGCVPIPNPTITADCVAGRCEVLTLQP